jgi:hypothetical protein
MNEALGSVPSERKGEREREREESKQGSHFPNDSHVQSAWYIPLSIKDCQLFVLRTLVSLGIIVAMTVSWIAFLSAVRNTSILP